MSTLFPDSKEMHLMRVAAPETASSSTVLLTSPYQVDLAKLRMERSAISAITRPIRPYGIHAATSVTFFFLFFDFIFVRVGVVVVVVVVVVYFFVTMG